MIPASKSSSLSSNGVRWMLDVYREEKRPIKSPNLVFVNTKLLFHRDIFFFSGGNGCDTKLCRTALPTHSTCTRMAWPLPTAANLLSIIGNACFSMPLTLSGRSIGDSKVASWRAQSRTRCIYSIGGAYSSLGRLSHLFLHFFKPFQRLRFNWHNFWLAQDFTQISLFGIYKPCFR